MAKTGRPGHSLYTEYLRARDHQAVVRRDRIARGLPRAAVRAAPVGLLVALVAAFGAKLPGGLAVLAFLVIFVGWTGAVVLAAFGADPDIETLRLGAEAERKTARTIARLRRQGYVVMHDRAVPHSEATIGHLLVGPGGVLLLRSDPAKGIVRYTKGGATVDGEALKPSIDRAAWLAGEVRSQLGAAMPMLKIPVNPILVMVEADVLWSDGALDGVTIINIKDVVGYVRSRPGRLNPAEVKQIVAAVERLFPAYSANQLAEQIVVDRDQWLTLMDALRTIRERDGDASDLLDRLAQIENDLGRKADSTPRSGLPLAVPDPDAADPDAADPATAQPAAPARGARRGRILASVRPLPDAPADDQNGADADPDESSPRRAARSHRAGRPPRD
jgi:Nuclease-related domain